MRPCWADLPGDLLTIIAEKASTTNTQYVHLRAVCKAWRRALTPHPNHLPPQFPWLMLPKLSISDADIFFYDMARSKTYRFQLPYVSGKYHCGSSHGWLVLEHEHRVSLLNPVTSRCINLPSFDAPPTLRKMYVSSNAIYPTCIAKVCLSCTPSKPGCIVVAWFFSSSNWELGFCRIGDSQWTELKWDAGPSVMDFTLYNNLVYTVNTKMEISVYDLQDRSVWTFPSKFNFYNRMHDEINLVEGDADSSGPLIVITVDCGTMDFVEINKVCVYKWCDERQRWHRVKEIGKRVLFLNMRNSINLQCDEKQENDVYYDIRHSVTIESFRIGIHRANLESGKVVPHKLSTMDVFPSMCGLPLWVTPSLI
ncbi:F-box protein [Carex littledalei]|uniref:F-box protein n=1 Tax=Carex littledalei TaxID=544730 RepID=A0A833VRM8_9POAL|nr:F-box protein [Carex littledalei]